jgi:hypothetical protein
VHGRSARGSIPPWCAARPLLNRRSNVTGDGGTPAAFSRSARMSSDRRAASAASGACGAACIEGVLSQRRRRCCTCDRCQATRCPVRRRQSPQRSGEAGDRLFRGCCIGASGAADKLCRRSCSAERRSQRPLPGSRRTPTRTRRAFRSHTDSPASAAALRGAPNDGSPASPDSSMFALLPLFAPLREPSERNGGELPVGQLRRFRRCRLPSCGWITRPRPRPRASRTRRRRIATRGTDKFTNVQAGPPMR